MPVGITFFPAIEAALTEAFGEKPELFQAYTQPSPDYSSDTVWMTLVADGELSQQLQEIFSEAQVGHVDTSHSDRFPDSVVESSDVDCGCDD